MMVLGLKFLVIIFTITHFVKCHGNYNGYHPSSSKPDFHPSHREEHHEMSIRPRISSTPPTIEVITPHTIHCEPHNIFRLSNVGLKRIGKDFIESDDIISVSLDDNEINDISKLAFRGMPNLRHLNLSKNKISTEKILSFAKSDRLETLIINNNDPPETDVEVLKEFEVFKSLKYLQLRNSQLGNLQVSFHLATPILNHLDLSNNSITSTTVFDNIPTTLTHLNLGRNLIKSVEQQKLRYVQELIMDNNKITEICFENCQKQFLSLKGAFKMHSLSLSKNLISNITIDAFKDSSELTNLDLSDNNIIDVVKGTFDPIVSVTELSLAKNRFVTVPDVCPMSRLKILNLNGNGINVIHINSFCHLKELDVLYLANNNLTTIESRAFMNLPSLNYLDLSGNQLSQLPVLWISPWPLRELHLEGNQFTELGDTTLIHIKALRDVYLADNPMPSFKVASVQLFPPQLTIHMKSTYTKDKGMQCKCESDENEDSEEEYD